MRIRRNRQDRSQVVGGESDYPNTLHVLTSDALTNDAEPTFLLASRMRLALARALFVKPDVSGDLPAFQSVLSAQSANFLVSLPFSFSCWTSLLTCWT